jgi:glycosyltransferase involved in cell wall biosynthesis
MKVLLVNKFFFLKGGSERVFFQERDFLINNGVNVLDFSMKDSSNISSDCSNYFISNIDYHSNRRFFTGLNQALKFIHSSEAIEKLEKLVKDEKPDIAHLHNIYHQITPSIISVLKKHNVRVVLTLHDGKLICPRYLMLDKGKICTACRGHSFWKAVFKNCVGSRGQGLLLAAEAYWHKWVKSYEEVDLFISPSRFLADLVSKRISREKIRVIHNGIDLGAYCYSSNDDGYALYFGRLSKEKGIETLLQAHKNLDDAGKLVVVGTGLMEHELQKRYQKAEYLGYKAGEALKRIIENSAFVIVPSEWYENCSMVILEAMAIGKPVIGSRVGGIPEQIDDGRTGLLFEMGNKEELAKKMNMLSKDPDTRKRMGLAARKKLEQEYSLNQHCTKVMQIYEELIS